MFKLGKCKQVLAYFISVSLLSTFVFGNISVYASEYTKSDVFTFTYTIRDTYTAVFADNYVDVLTSLGTTELEIPYTYDNGVNGEKMIESVSISSVKDNYITKVILDEGYSTVTWARAFRYFTKLETVEFKYKGNDFSIGSMFRDNTSIKEVYIYASTMSVSDSAFRGLSSDAKVYVTSEAVKNAIVEGTAYGSYPVSADQVIVMTSEKPNSEFTITCENITYKTEGGLKPQANITSGDGAITYKLFSDEACLNEYTGYSYNSPYLPMGTYYLKGFMAATDNYQSSSSKPIEARVLPNTNVNKSTLNSIYEEANSFFEENQYYKEDYDTIAWNNVYARGGALSKAEEIIKDTEGRFTQSEIDTAADNLTTSLKHLKESPASTDEVWAELLVEQAEGIIKSVENGEEIYTEKSYENLLNNLQNAKDLDKTTSTKRIINNRISALQYAIDKLEVDPGEIIPAGEPFAYVEKGGKEAKVVSLIADESMNGSAKIKITFDCAKDVSFNESASIEVKATAGGIQSYQKFMGNSWTQGATCEIELPLVQEIKTGDQVDISAFTYSWDNAADYVYGITKVEFYDSKGHILKTIIDKDIAKETLAETISKAEAIDTTPYTDESVAELTKAIEAARALTDEATAEDINSAIKAIEDAISGLKLKVVTGTVTGTIKVSDTDDTTEMTVTAVSSDGTETTVTATSMGAYTIENLEAGSYTLTISGGKYAARSYEITVAEGENALDAELNPLGDINGDGKVTTADVGKANSHAKGVITLTDYDFACADVKNDGSITTADVGMINSHAKGVSTLW